MKDDTISRQAAIDAVSRGCGELRGIFAECEKNLNALPSAERHGHWKGINRNKYNDDEATCSVCGVTFSSGYSDPSWWDYCPNCGARMDEEENK